MVWRKRLAADSFGCCQRNNSGVKFHFHVSSAMQSWFYRNKQQQTMKRCVLDSSFPGKRSWCFVRFWQEKNTRWWCLEVEFEVKRGPQMDTWQVYIWNATRSSWVELGTSRQLMPVVLLSLSCPCLSLCSSHLSATLPKGDVPLPSFDQAAAVNGVFS